MHILIYIINPICSRLALQINVYPLDIIFSYIFAKFWSQGTNVVNDTYFPFL